MSEEDFLDELIKESKELYPEFPELMAAAGRRRELIEELAGIRKLAKMSQTAVAASMKTSQSSIARFESYEFSPNLSTLEKYAYAVGQRIEFKLVPIPEEDAKEESSAEKVG